MLEESVTNEEKILVFTWKSTFMDNEIALFMTGFVKILLWVDLENVVAHLETDWLQLRGNIFTAVLHMAEGLVRGAVEVWESLLPFQSDLLEHIWRD